MTPRQPTQVEQRDAHARQIRRSPRPLRFGLRLGSLVGVRLLTQWWGTTLRGEIARMEAEGAFVKHGSHSAPYVALTFDDSPHPIYTPQVIEVLNRYGVKGTFFCVGEQMEANADLARRMVADGHVLGNHSWSHPVLALLSPADLHAELVRTSDIIERVTQQRPAYFRPPSSALSPHILHASRELGMTIAMYDVEARDWANPGVDAIVNQVIQHARPGSVILLHDAGGDRSQTVAALPAIIEGLRQRGLEFATLDGMRARSSSAELAR